jgi:hypothetical protein
MEKEIFCKTSVTMYQPALRHISEEFSLMQVFFYNEEKILPILTSTFLKCNALKTDI